MDGDVTAVLTDRIRRALNASRIVQMPFLKGDEAREQLLHRLGRAAGCGTHTVGFIAFSGKVTRYGLVQLELKEQGELI